jgi:hypothetical protein
MDNLLSKYLNVGLLPHLETNERFTYVESATEDINKRLSKNRGNLIRYTLTALNPNVSEEQPVIRETDEALRKYWKTIRVNVSDAPRQIWRAIIWEALNRQSKDHTAAAIIWLTASSLIQLINLDSNECELLTEFLLSLRDKTEQHAVGKWQKPQSAKLTLESLRLDLEAITVGSVINDEFEQDIVKACGPSDVEGNSITGANPNLPSTNAANNAKWADEFATRMAAAIGKRIDGSSGELIQTIQTELDKLLSTLSQDGTDSLRSDLLWWRQALYSNILKSSYRQVGAVEAAFFMAFDLHRLLPTLHPSSVEYLLREALRAAHNEQSEARVSLSVVFDKLRTCPRMKFIEKEIGNYYKNWDAPLPLLAQIKNSVNSGTASKESLTSIGLHSETEVILEDLAVWFFRDLQAHRLAVQK